MEAPLPIWSRLFPFLSLSPSWFRFSGVLLLALEHGGSWCLARDQGNPRLAGTAQRRRRLRAPFFLFGGVAGVPCLHPYPPPERKPKIYQIGRRRRAARRVLLRGVAWGVWCSVRLKAEALVSCRCSRWPSFFSLVVIGRSGMTGVVCYPSWRSCSGVASGFKFSTSPALG
jgi:hypothetical protein